VSPYGVTKLAAEHLLQAYVREFDFPAVILRYFSIYGPRQRPDMAYQIFIEALHEGSAVTIFGDGQQSRSNTYVADCVRGTIQAAMGAEVGEIYNIGGGVPITLRQAVSVIASAMGVEAYFQPAPARPGDQRHTAADTSKAAEAFGFAPTVTPHVGLIKQVEAYLADVGRVREPSASGALQSAASTEAA
jgi:nucleoside-diphosphate-sugar epimerase